MKVLSPTQISSIEKGIDAVFARLKDKFLGKPTDKANSLRMTRKQVGMELSLPHLYVSSSVNEGNTSPDKDLLNSVMSIAENHINSQRDTAKATVIKTIENFVRTNPEGNSNALLGGQLVEIFAKTSDAVKRTIDTESTTARNTGTLDGIVKICSSVNIDDPSVYFVTIKDSFMCNECRRLHLRPDGKPIVWKMSDLQHGYHKKGDNKPSVSGLHPYCRCSLVMLMPGYGFGDDGRVTFIKKDHDEYSNQ